MSRIFMILMLFVYVSFISACTQAYKNSSILIEPDDSPFTGIHPANFSGNKSTVILMHGMCSHDKKWVSEVTRKMGFAAEVGDPLKTNSKTDVKVYKANWQEGDNAVDFYGIIYSPELNKVKKEYLCSDINQKTIKNSYCSAPNQYDRTRASLNNSIKNKLMNDCLADAVVYSGETGLIVRQGVRDALNAIEADQKGSKAPITLVSQSLGSKVLRDSLVCEEEKSSESLNKNIANQIDKSIEFLTDTQQVFLVSNQIALLNRGNGGQCKINSNLSKLRNATINPDGSTDRSTDKNKGSVFDLFDLISNTKVQKMRSLNNKTLKKSILKSNFNVVSFTDPNDLLSYEVDPKEYKNYPVTNVVVSNAATYLGLIANPVTVHMGYFANPDVSKLLRCGRSLGKTKACN